MTSAFKGAYEFNWNVSCSLTSFYAAAASLGTKEKKESHILLFPARAATHLPVSYAPLTNRELCLILNGCENILFQFVNYPPSVRLLLERRAVGIKDANAETFIQETTSEQPQICSVTMVQADASIWMEFIVSHLFSYQRVEG